MRDRPKRSDIWVPTMCFYILDIASFSWPGWPCETALVWKIADTMYAGKGTSVLVLTGGMIAAREKNSTKKYSGRKYRI